MSEEDKINQRLRDAQDKYLRENYRQQNGAINDVSALRIELLTILDKYADSDGHIDKRKIRKILRELGDVEDDIERALVESVEESIDKTIENAIKTTIGAIGLIYIVSKLPKGRIKSSVTDSVLDGKHSDGMSLRDRMWRMSGGIVDEVRTNVRDGVLRDKSINSINRDIKKTFKDKDWQVRRVVMTEGYNAYRETVGEVASEVGNDIIKAVRIIDLRGRHDNHESHECYRLAEQDMYGWGKGLYRPQDTFIYNPHPNCTAYFEYVLVDEKTGEVS